MLTRRRCVRRDVKESTDRMDAPANRRIVLFLLAVLAAFLLRCRQSETRAEEPPPIEIKATVHPARSATITAQIDGQVQTIDVREGDAVTANGRIVELTNAVVERDAAVARAQLAWIETRLRRGGRAPVRVAARPRDNVDITARILEVKQQRLEKMKQLRKTNDITAREVEQAEVEYLAALRDYNQERRGSIGPSPATDDMELLRIEHDKTAAEEQFATQRHALLQITSPIAGTVTRVSVTQGQAVFPRDPIAEVSDVATLHVTGNVAPELLRYIHAGMPVQVKIFSVPPRTFADEIDYVVPVQGSGSDSRTAMVVVSIPNPDRSVQPNTDALITLRTK
jgi:multidrug resistance efflux pump